MYDEWAPGHDDPVEPPVGDVEALCRAVADTLGRRHPVEVHAWLYDLDGEHLHAEGRWAPTQTTLPSPGSIIGPDPAMLARLFDDRRHVRVAGGDVPASWELGSVGGAVLVPLVVGVRRSGVLVVARPEGRPELTVADETDTADLAARRAVLFDHARLVAGAARSTVRQRHLSRIGERALAADHLDDIETFVMAEVQQAMAADGIVLFSVLADGVTGVVIGASGLPEHVQVGTTFTLSGHSLRRLAARDTEVSAADVGNINYDNSLAATIGFATSCSVLLVPQGGTPLFVGVGRTTRRMFAGPERRFLASAAHLLTAALELRGTHARLRRQATSDPLTGLPNRVLFHERLRAGILAARERGTPVALVLADLDGFKLVNDSMGHTEGDRFLSAVAARLASVVRPVDLVARLGGDEFALVCASTDERAAVAIGRRALDAIAGPVALNHLGVEPRASLGVAVFDPTAADDRPSVADVASEMVKQADLAMYEAKRAGGNTIAVYDALLDEQVRRRLRIEAGVRSAVANGAFTLAYQPVVGLEDGSIIGVDALVRWHDDDLGDVGPAEFIPVAETSTLVCAIDQWVLRTAARQAVAWGAEGFAWPGRVGVNLSSRTVAQPRFADQVARVLAEERCAPDRLLVEVHECPLATGGDHDGVESLLDLGIAVSVSDHRVGHPSIAQLRRLPAHHIKIERSVTAGLLTDPVDAAIVRSTLALAHDLGKSVVAEGVETVEQLREVHRLGCAVAQGYLLGRPSDATTMTRWLRNGLDVSVPALLGTSGGPTTGTA